MARTRLQRCKECSNFGLGEKCEQCGGAMEAVAPLKFSPEDPQGARRRKRVDAGSQEWVDSLPSPRKSDEE
ncbi:MAG: nucleolar RNA-binding Nop10p family protein [Candidatus Thalassarchaeaceae archaeon]|nr:nucleolar RNA-binding Nop10p family protein [Candidatus Thalassarchaeaceae archaeon]MEE2630136.1 nucleolar RNA-binding Nop10p family protein [Candidatus Thermoplasmatota archaeon]